LPQTTIFAVLSDRGATTAEKLRGPRFGSQHRGACVPRQVKDRAGCWVRKGSTLPLCGSGGITPGKFLKTQMLNPACWWLLAVKFLAFLKTTAKKLGGPIHCWSPNLKVGGPVSPVRTAVVPMLSDAVRGIPPRKQRNARIFIRSFYSHIKSSFKNVDRREGV